MQGQGHDPGRSTPLRGNDIVLAVDDPSTTVDAEALAAALQTPRAEVWPPVTAHVDEDGVFESIHLWLASQPRPYGALTVERERAADLLDPDNRFVCPTLLTADSFAHLTLRQTRTWRLSVRRPRFRSRRRRTGGRPRRADRGLGPAPPARTRAPHHRAPGRCSSARDRQRAAACATPAHHDRHHLARGAPRSGGPGMTGAPYANGWTREPGEHVD